MKVLVLGGLGFCGWPTSLYLSAHGHEVMIVDDESRREIDKELGTQSLTPIQTPEERIKAWKEVSGRGIDYREFRVGRDEPFLEQCLEWCDAVVHFAEQRAAPYSMKSPWHRRYTVEGNIQATSSLLSSLLKYPRPLVHLGTAGIYGYDDSAGRLPEGWIDWGDDRRLYPSKPGSVYHATKSLDLQLFEFYARNDGLAITDLEQGIVWGTQTEETKRDERLINRFDYDEIFGSVLNRFLVEGVVGHPLTVYGTGGQTRAFIHIRDTVKCVRMAIENPPERGELKIYNQMAECLKVRDLADKISRMTGVETKYWDNPRKEKNANALVVVNDGLKNLGWEPIILDDGLLEEVMEIVGEYQDRVDFEFIPPKTRW